MRRRDVRFLFQQADHHDDRQPVFDGDPAQRVDRIEQPGVLHQQQRALVARGQPGADRDAFVLLADAHQTRVGVLACERRSSPSLVVRSGTETTNSIPLALISRMMLSPDSPATVRSATALTDIFIPCNLCSGRDSGFRSFRKLETAHGSCNYRIYYGEPLRTSPEDALAQGKSAARGRGLSDRMGALRQRMLSIRRPRAPLDVGRPVRSVAGIARRDGLRSTTIVRGAEAGPANAKERVTSLRGGASLTSAART